MFSELLRIPMQVGAVPLFGVGLLLLLWLAFSGYGAYRSKWSVDAWVTMAFGAAVIVGLPRIFPQGVPIRSYGLMMLLGCLSGLWLSLVRGRRAGISGETMVSLAMHMFVPGILGARLFYLIEYWESRIKQPTWGETIVTALSFTEGGLVVYGSLLGAVLGFVYFCWRKKLPTLAVGDLVAPSLLVGLMFGRVGCLLNGCCYGGACEAPYAITFPRESSPGRPSGPYLEQASQGRFYGFRMKPKSAEEWVPMIAEVVPNSAAAVAGLKPGMRVAGVGKYATETITEAEGMIAQTFLSGKPLVIYDGQARRLQVAAVEGPPRSDPVHPTQIYSAVNAGLLGWLLWVAYAFRSRDGQLVALMLTLYPIARYTLEEIRIDESPVFGTGLSISQNVSVVLLLVAAALWVKTARQPAGRLQFFASRTNQVAAGA